MLFFSIAYLFTALVDWYRFRNQQSTYRRVVADALREGSVIFSATSAVEPFILQSKEAKLLEDNGVVVSSITPKKIVNLSEWTLYFAQDSGCNWIDVKPEMVVLLEAVECNTTGSELPIPEANKVRVLDHGSPVARKSGTPFAILLRCCLEDFVSLGVAFANGVLTMEDDLKVKKIMSVEIEGPLILPLMSKTNGSLQYSNQQQSNIDDCSLSETSNWTNDSLASCDSIADVDLIDNTDSEKTSGQTVQNGINYLDNNGLVDGLCDADSSLASSPCLLSYTPYSKPPNVLIYSGKKDSSRKFDDVKKALEQCLNGDCYVIYHLTHDLVSTTPWTENTCLLVIACENLYDDVDKTFLSYFQSGGKIVNFGSSFDELLLGRQEVRNSAGIAQLNYKRWKDVSIIAGRYIFPDDSLNAQNIMVSSLAADKTGRTVIMEVNGKSVDCTGSAILSQALLYADTTEMADAPDMFNSLKKSNHRRLVILRHVLRGLDINCCAGLMPDLTPCVLLADETKKSTFLESIGKILHGGVLKSSLLSLKFASCPDEVEKEVTANILPVITNSDTINIQYFNETCYWKNHFCQRLGNCVLYTDVVPTTMKLLKGLQFSVPENVGLIAIAGRQTRGQGRGKNAWVSPVGCAMFTLHVQLPAESDLGRHACFLQHITSLAVAHSVTTLPGYEQIDLRLKWPNDIYNSSEMKLGGVIVKSTTVDGTVHSLIGCGFNVTNSNPTICINDIIEFHNIQFDTEIAPCSVEQLIARTVSIIEELIDDFQNNGQSNFCTKYYNSWLHSGQKVKLESEGCIDVTVTGLDEYGYLQVVASDGRKLSVQPDGNSFDMMHNLIRCKS